MFGLNITPEKYVHAPSANRVVIREGQADLKW